MGRVGHAASGASATTGTTFTITLSTGVPAGDWLIGAVVINPFPATVLPGLALADTHGNTYTIRGSTIDSSKNETIYLIDCKVGAGKDLISGDVITATATGGSFARWVGDFDQYTGGLAYETFCINATSSITANANTLTTAGGLAVACFGFGTAHGPATPAAGWTANTPVTAGVGTNSADRTVLTVYQTTTAGSVHETAAMASSGPYAAGILSYTVTVAFAHSASGTATASGSVAATSARSKSVTGSATKAGSASAATTRTSAVSGSGHASGSVAGITARTAALSGGIVATGSVSMRKSIATTLSGHATATGSAASATARSVQVAGAVHGSGSATGAASADSSAAVSGTVTASGSATATTARAAATVGHVSVSAVITAETARSAAVAGHASANGSATGERSVALHNITATTTLGARRWDAELTGQRRYTSTLGKRRWTAKLEKQNG